MIRLLLQCVIEGNIKFISYNYNNEEVGYMY